MEKNFDYIIVGGGSAGCALANRLTSKAENNVLLIEAGKTSHPLSRMPVSFAMCVRCERVIVMISEYFAFSYVRSREPNVSARAPMLLILFSRSCSPHLEAFPWKDSRPHAVASRFVSDLDSMFRFRTQVSVFEVDSLFSPLRTSHQTPSRQT